jgi:putrescine transport system ATP-binding protein
VAGFIGSANMFDGEITKAGKDGLTIAVPQLGGDIAAANSAALKTGDAVCVAVRPEKIFITRDKPKSANAFPGTVRDLGYFGKDSLYRIVTASGALVSVNNVNARRGGESDRIAQWEDKVWLSFEPSSAIVLTE